MSGGPRCDGGHDVGCLGKALRVFEGIRLLLPSPAASTFLSSFPTCASTTSLTPCSPSPPPPPELILQ
eukprot:8530011-Pyramimonas_sp.AAC.1